MIDSTVCSNIKMINILEYKWDKSMHERFGQAVLGEEISEYKNYDFNTQMLEFRLVNSITVLEKRILLYFNVLKILIFFTHCSYSQILRLGDCCLLS